MVNTANFDAARVVIDERKRGYLLAFEGYLFACNKAGQQKIYWRCTDRSDQAYEGMTFSLSHKRSCRNPVWNGSTTDTNEVE